MRGEGSAPGLPGPALAGALRGGAEAAGGGGGGTGKDAVRDGAAAAFDGLAVAAAARAGAAGAAVARPAVPAERARLRPAASVAAAAGEPGSSRSTTSRLPIRAGRTCTPGASSNSALPGTAVSACTLRGGRAPSTGSAPEKRMVR